MNGDSFRGGAFGFNIDLLTKVSIKIINLKTKKSIITIMLISL